MRVKCLAQEHNTMSPARARTRTAQSVDERTNHEATGPPTCMCAFTYHPDLQSIIIIYIYLLNLRLLLHVLFVLFKDAC